MEVRLQIWRLVIFHIFNFSSATRGHFWNVSALFISMANWSKKYHSDFWNTLSLLNYHPEYHEGHLKDSVCTFCLIKLPIHNISKIWMILFWPMVHRCKKCSDISEVTSGGRAEIENVKNDRSSDLQCHLHQQMLLLKCHCIFYIFGPLGKKAFCRILKRWFITWITGQNPDFRYFWLITSKYP